MVRSVHGSPGGAGPREGGSIEDEISLSMEAEISIERISSKSRKTPVPPSRGQSPALSLSRGRSGQASASMDAGEVQEDEEVMGAHASMGESIADDISMGGDSQSVARRSRIAESIQSSRAGAGGVLSRAGGLSVSHADYSQVRVDEKRRTILSEVCSPCRKNCVCRVDEKRRGGKLWLDPAHSES